MNSKIQKLYCYVDESGQDARSDFYVVVSIVSAENQNALRERIIKLEQESNFGQKKWHKSRSPEREEFLELLVQNNIAAGDIYYSHYKKRLPFFLPLLETLSKAILMAAPKNYRCVIYVDGIDFQKAVELTNALRLKGIKTAFVRSARDESEPLIRLADRWVGCIRASLEDTPRCKDLVAKATNQNYLKLV